MGIGFSPMVTTRKLLAPSLQPTAMNGMSLGPLMAIQFRQYHGYKLYRNTKGYALPLIFPMLVWLSNVLTFRGELQLPILQSRGNPFALHNFRSLLHHAAHAARSTDGLEGLWRSRQPVARGERPHAPQRWGNRVLCLVAAVAPQRSHRTGGNLWAIYGILWDTSILSMDHWVLCRDLVTVREVVSRTPIWRDLWDLFSHFWLPIDLIYRSEKVLMCVFLHRLDGLNWIRLHSKISTQEYGYPGYPMLIRTVSVSTQGFQKVKRLEPCLVMMLRYAYYSRSENSPQPQPVWFNETSQYLAWISHIHVKCVRVLPIYIFTYVVYYVYIYTHLFIYLTAPHPFGTCNMHRSWGPAEDHQRWMEPLLHDDPKQGNWATDRGEFAVVKPVFSWDNPWVPSIFQVG